jgi:hypothetical protein
MDIKTLVFICYFNKSKYCISLLCFSSYFFGGKSLSFMIKAEPDYWGMELHFILFGIGTMV